MKINAILKIIDIDKKDSLSFLLPFYPQLSNSRLFQHVWVSWRRLNKFTFTLHTQESTQSRYNSYTIRTQFPKGKLNPERVSCISHIIATFDSIEISFCPN